MKTQWQQSLNFTALSPIHIGTGQDLEPIEYVIFDKHIYHYPLTLLNDVFSEKERQDFMNLVERCDSAEDLLKIRSLIHHKGSQIAQSAPYRFEVDQAINEKYQNAIGRKAHASGAQNRLQLQRAAINPYTQQTYLPGSTIKGAIRTALSNKRLQENHRLISKIKGERNAKSQLIEKELFNFKSPTEDPFKSLQIQDAMPLQQAQKFTLVTNYPKKLDKEARRGGIPVMVETIMPGSQYQGGCLIKSIQRPAGEQALVGSYESLVEQVNTYTLPKFIEEIERYKKDPRVGKEWLATTEAVMKELVPYIQKNELMILKMGHYAGAKIKSWDGVRKITNAAKRGTFLEDSTTFWLNSEKQPLGWLIAYPAENGSIAQILSNHFSLPTASSPSSAAPMGVMHTQTKEQEEAEKKAEIEAERLSNLPAPKRKLIELEKAFQAEKQNPNPAGELRQQLTKTIQEAMEDPQNEWIKEDKQQLKSLLKSCYELWGINLKKNKKAKQLMQELDANIND